MMHQILNLGIDAQISKIKHIVACENYSLQNKLYNHL